MELDILNPPFSIDDWTQNLAPYSHALDDNKGTKPECNITANGDISSDFGKPQLTYSAIHAAFDQSRLLAKHTPKDQDEIPNQLVVLNTSQTSTAGHGPQTVKTEVKKRGGSRKMKPKMTHVRGKQTLRSLSLSYPSPPILLWI